MSAKIVIVGGGFGGLTTVQALKRVDADVTLVDRQNHHLFQPLLYQVAMAGLAPSEIAAPIRSIVHKLRRVTVLLDEVTGVDLEQKRVLLMEGGGLPYDYLVLAPGARTHYFGHDEWEHFAPGLKNLDDAVEIRRRVLVAFEAAERAGDPALRAKLLSFVVIGGGPTGVELAGAIAELARHVLSRDFRHVKPSEARVLLIEAGPRVLSTFEPDLSERAVQQLSELGVHVRTGSMVSRIGSDGVTLANGEVIAADTVLWAAGVSASPLLKTIGLELDRSGRAVVGPDCALKGRPDVFVIGDAAFMLDAHGKPLPGVSPVAMQMGRYVAQVIASELRAKSSGTAPAARQPFRYFDKGSMATIGRSRAIAEAGRLKLSGFLAWLAWLMVHIWYLIGFRNRLLVMFDWAWSYFTYRRGARLITGGRLQPGAPVRASRPPLSSSKSEAAGAAGRNG
ncbi:MAG: NAD(P)/FAD-dependent oxidoreductase [Myxococcales bacterium]